MKNKITLFGVACAVAAFIILIMIQNKRQSQFEKQPPVIEAVSEIEKNLKESDQKAK